MSLQAIVLEAQDKADAAVKGVRTGTVETEEELATAEAYCRIANTETCPDFTAMTCKETKAWTKAHKDILPKDWNKMNAVQKNVWINSSIYCPATLAKEEKTFADNELAKAKARKVKADLELDRLNKVVIAPKKPAKPEGLEAAGFFTIGKSTFNKQQKAAWKESIEKLGKEFDYTVTGYTDRETGTENLNSKLREARSEYVKALMIEEGFTGEITTVSASANERYVEKPTYKNRAAVIR